MITQFIRGIGTAVPEHIVGQADVRTVVQSLFGGSSAEVARLLAVFDHDHIEQRHFAMPLSWYAEEHTWAEQNEVWRTQAIALAVESANRAIQDAGISAKEVDRIVIASTTGFATPSIDVEVMMQLGCKATTARLPVVGLGCAGGVAGLRHAASWNGTVLFIAVEICTVTFQKGDPSKSNIVGTSLFADGAAAVVMSPEHDGGGRLAIRGGHSVVFPGTEDIMGWDIQDSGLKVRFRRDIPAFVEQHSAGVLTEACLEWGIRRSDIQSVIAHPGGAKVLQALALTYGFSGPCINDAADVLRMHGNMSSPTVLFVLQRAITRGLETGYHVMSALGPGFSSEHVLLEVV